MAQFKITIYDASGVQKTSATVSSLPTTSLTGTLQAAQFPALTGDVNTSAGSLATAYAGVVPVAKGGTHADLSATGGAYQVLKQITSGADITVSLPGSALLNTFTTFSGSAALTISSISQVFQDLEVTLLIRSGTAAATDTLYVQFGAGSLDTTAANYTSYDIIHFGASGSVIQSALENFGSVAQLKMAVLGNTAPSNDVSLIVLRIPRYSSADAQKQIVGMSTGLYQGSAGGLWQGGQAGVWRNTAAVEQIKLTLLSGGNFASGCAYSVRGLAA